MQSSDRKTLIKNATTNLMRMFETGKMPEAIALTLIRRKEDDSQPSYKWSLGNQILMFASDTSDARGYRQWQEVGRYVKKGSQAILILAPLTRKVSNDAGAEKIVITGFRPIPVYRLEDTDGKPLIRPDYTPLTLPPFWDVAERLGLEVKYVPVSGNYYGKFSPHKGRITLCSKDAFVYFHELAHAVHNSISPLKGGQIPEQEIVAELTAAVLCQLQNIQGYESEAYNYITQYVAKMKEQDVIKVIMRVLGEVEQVVERILDVAYQIHEPRAVIARGLAI